MTLLGHPDRRCVMRSEAEHALIQAILDAPEGDDEARLVFADYLMDRGDPRGELIAVQCRAQNPALEDRALNLFDVDARWLGAWEGETDTWRFHRGFLDHLAIPIDTFTTFARMLFEADPYPDELVHLRSLVLHAPRGPTPRGWEPPAVRDARAARELSAILERLRLASLAFDFEITPPFAAELTPRALATVTELRVPVSSRAAHVPALLLDRVGDRLDTLALGRLALDHVPHLAQHPRYLAQIRHLAVTPPDDASGILLVTPNLVSLDLGRAALAEPFLRALARVRPPLVELLTYGLRADSYVALARLEALETLDVRHSRMDDGAIDALVALPRLETLNIAHTHITSAGLVQLHREAPSLRELTLTTRGLSDQVLDQLRRRFTLHRWH